ncbi:MAG: cupin domain-containing protein [Candidatus Omnitrophica bacterium]|nr:cupin domain-containing protein [Candidatus Omnitrophota bacterium]
MATGTVEDLSKIMEFPRRGVFSRVLVKSGAANCTLMCLARGSDISEHTSTRDASVTVLKGEGTFVLGDREIKLAPGVFIFMPAHTPHSLSASDDLAILLSLYGKG